MEDVDAHLARHHGVISRVEALDLGLSPGQISRRLRTGRWELVGPRAYRLVGTPRTFPGSARALALSTRGVISHRAAARLHGIDGFGRARLEVTVSPSVGRGKRSGVIWHRSTQMHLIEAVSLDGVAVTGAARTVLDLAAVVRPTRFAHAVDSVLRRRITTWPELYAVLIRHSRRGRNGCGPLRALLEDRYGQAVPDSRWNRLVGELLSASGIDGFVYEHEVVDDRGHFVARVDLAWPDHRLAVELDSHQFHDNSASFVSDRRRVNRLAACGWQVLAFTWADYKQHPADLVALVRHQLQRRI